MLHPNSYEPYSAVAFQKKQPTSPYPEPDNDGRNNFRHREAFLDALLESRPTLISTAKTNGWKWRLRRSSRNRLIAVLAVVLFLAYVFSDSIAISWAFFRIKLDNALFDRGWIPCGTLRKSPMLYIQDTHHLQVVWEMNCGTREMAVTWTKVGTPSTTTTTNVHETEPVEALVLDDRHALYKTTIGPLQEGGEYTYQVQVLHPYRRQVASARFRWHATLQSGTDAKQQGIIRIAAMGDNQFGLRTFVRLLRQIDKRVDYLIHAGDAVQNYPSLRQWQTDFVGPLTYYGLGQTMPMIYAHGNHDHDPTYEYHYTRVSPSSDPWYAFSMAEGAIRFVVLDSNLDWEQQDEWLGRELTSQAFQNAQFRVVVVHIPPFLEYWDPDAWNRLGQKEWGAFVKERFVPLFEKFGVDLVISGHQHNYERGERNGIHYTIIGGAGGDLDFEQVEDWGMYHSTALEFHYVLLEFRPPPAVSSSAAAPAPWELVWKAFDLKGQLIDTMTVFSKIRTQVEEEDIPVLEDIQGAVAGETIEELTYNELLDDNPQLEEELTDATDF
ncbi:Metallo-dependent phosphatase-like protein [Dichotomocladium elegans]|nr:Metallo-dependent phosphatase-like protein [Dichotomocladium elegans]